MLSGHSQSISFPPSHHTHAIPKQPLNRETKGKMPPDLNTLSYDPSLPAADISSDLSHLGHRRPSSAWSCWTTIHDYVSVDGKPRSPFASLACMLSAPLREAGRERNEARTTEELVQHQRFHTTSRSPQEISEKSARSGDELSGLAAVLADADSAHQAPVGQGPLVAYQEGLEEGLLRRDPLQERTVKELQRLYDELLDLYPSVRQRPRGGSGLTLTQASHSTDFNSESIRNSESPRRTKRLLQRPWWRTLFGTRSDGLESDFTNSWPRDEIEDNEEEFVEGMYMYGGVGCGKTMLMDLFVACAPPEFKVCCSFFPLLYPFSFMTKINSPSLSRRRCIVKNELNIVSVRPVGG